MGIFPLQHVLFEEIAHVFTMGIMTVYTKHTATYNLIMHDFSEPVFMMAHKADFFQTFPEEGWVS